MPGRRARAAALAALAWAASASAQELDPCGRRGPPIPPPPDWAPAAPPELEPDRARSGMGSRFDLGVGGVRVVAPEDGPPGWLANVEFPLYRIPGGELAGWVTGGWWVPPTPEADPLPLSSAAMVETGYESASWIALEARDGMARILLALDPGPGGDGSAWVSLCHLAGSDPPLELALWESALTGPLFYRNPSVRHALRAAPGSDRPLVDWLAGDDHDVMLEPLEIRGDWMRVRVSRPSTYCVDPPPDARVDEGWVRWRDPGMGPWVWRFTRGC